MMEHGRIQAYTAVVEFHRCPRMHMQWIPGTYFWAWVRGYYSHISPYPSYTDNAPPIVGVKPESAATLTIFAEFWCFGLAADWHKHMAVAIVSAECCLDYGECIKMCFSGVPKLVKVNIFPAAFFIKRSENAQWSHKSVQKVSKFDKI